MSKQISGNSVVFQIGSESTYGNSAAGSEQIRISSESFKPTYNKVAEGLATGGKGNGKVQTMGIQAGGSFATLLRPDMGSLLKCLLGVETTEVGKKVYTAIGNGLTEHLPSFTAYVDRIVDVFAYPGTKINTATISASAGNYVTFDAECTSRSEEEGASLTPSLVPSAEKAFVFASGSVKVNGTKLADVRSFSLAYNNNLAADTQTTDTGDYYMEPECGTREITGDISMVYAEGAEDFRKDFYKTDDTFSLELKLTSGEKSLTITIPAVQVTDATANMGSPTDFLNQSVSWSAVENGEDEYITFALED